MDPNQQNQNAQPNIPNEQAQPSQPVQPQTQPVASQQPQPQPQPQAQPTQPQQVPPAVPPQPPSPQQMPTQPNSASHKQKLDKKAVWLFFIRFIPAMIIFSTFLIPFGLSVGGGFFAFILVILMIAILFVVSYLSYYFYSYELTAGSFSKEFGIIVRRSTNIPYERIQNVDIVRGLISRLLGLSDINIQTAGGSAYGLKSEGRLPAVTKQTALQIQAELLNRARGSHTTNQQPANTYNNGSGL